MDDKQLDITLDNYFNNVDLGMNVGKIVGHKQYVKKLINQEVTAVLERLEKYAVYGEYEVFDDESDKGYVVPIGAIYKVKTNYKEETK